MKNTKLVAALMGGAALRAHDSKVPNVELTGLRRPYGEGPVERHVGRQNGGTE